MVAIIASMPGIGSTLTYHNIARKIFLACGEADTVFSNSISLKHESLAARNNTYIALKSHARDQKITNLIIPCQARCICSPFKPEDAEVARIAADQQENFQF